ncbi:hypothetical protein [Paracoccus yeei]|uniref:hypothetical protein n=1 Tax=Paracoccus yeei TaxID=147645 RepID=UPI0028D737C2|nr:hypothetical protein [Paracoccus yeei]
MIEAARAENANGVQMRAGKKYTTVAIRVEMMRRHAGAFGIATEIVHWAKEAGSPIVVKATVTDEAGRVLATGHAEEIRGKGNVNMTSALENAETSAIGRALAALGLAGGEFASANEMDGVSRKSDAMAEAQKKADEAKSALMACATMSDLAAAWEALPKPLKNDPEVAAVKDVRKDQLTPEKDAA